MNTKLSGNATNRDFQDFAGLVEAIEVALMRFDAISDHAILRSYRQDDSYLHDLNFLGCSTQEYKEGKEQRHASMTQEHEVVFLVYL